MAIESDRAKQLLKRCIEATDALGATWATSPEFQKWKRDTQVAIEQIFGAATRHRADFSNISFSPGAYYQGMPEDSHITACKDGLDKARLILQSMIEEIDEFGVASSKTPARDSFAVVANFCSRFHLVSRQLRERHENRPTFDVEDEYDTQDLLHALLHLNFDDIRPEEWAPSYAGGSSRMDFLLKQERIVVEVKKTRKGLGAKEVGEQLIVDIQKYQTHPDCKALICFVYDPEGRIKNPRGLENDLNGNRAGIKVRVIIAP